MPETLVGFIFVILGSRTRPVLGTQNTSLASRIFKLEL